MPQWCSGNTSAFQAFVAGSNPACGSARTPSRHSSWVVGREADCGSLLNYCPARDHRFKSCTTRQCRALARYPPHSAGMGALPCGAETRLENGRPKRLASSTLAAPSMPLSYWCRGHAEDVDRLLRLQTWAPCRIGVWLSQKPFKLLKRVGVPHPVPMRALCGAHPIFDWAMPPAFDGRTPPSQGGKRGSVPRGGTKRDGDYSTMNSAIGRRLSLYTAVPRGYAPLV